MDENLPAPETAVVLWNGVEIILPTSADEYEEWRSTALAFIAQFSRIHEETKTLAGKLLWFELHYRGESAARDLRDVLTERLGVTDRTLNRWRTLVEDIIGLPAASPRVTAQQERSLRTSTPPVTREDAPSVSQEESRVGATPPEPTSIVPDAVLTPIRPSVSAPSVARHPSGSATQRPPEQLAFTFESPSQRLVSALSSIPAGRHEELADAIEKWLAKPQPGRAVTRRPSEVTPILKGKRP